jgi:hypothetical protein
LYTPVVAAVKLMSVTPDRTNSFAVPAVPFEQAVTPAPSVHCASPLVRLNVGGVPEAKVPPHPDLVWCDWSYAEAPVKGGANLKIAFGDAAALVGRVRSRAIATVAAAAAAMVHGPWRDREAPRRVDSMVPEGDGLEKPAEGESGYPAHQSVAGTSLNLPEPLRG